MDWIPFLLFVALVVGAIVYSRRFFPAAAADSASARERRARQEPNTVGDDAAAAAQPAPPASRTTAVVAGFAAVALVGVGLILCAVVAIVRAWVDSGGFNSVGPYEPPAGPEVEAKLDRIDSFGGYAGLAWLTAALALAALIAMARRVGSTGERVAICVVAWGLPVAWVIVVVLLARATW
jgi:hypothetical protein